MKKRMGFRTAEKSKARFPGNRAFQALIWREEASRCADIRPRVETTIGENRGTHHEGELGPTLVPFPTPRQLQVESPGTFRAVIRIIAKSRRRQANVGFF